MDKPGPGGGQHALFCADKKVVKVNKELKNNNAAVTRHITPDKVLTHWSRSIDLCGRAMVKAGDVLFVAGPASADEIYFDDKDAPSALAAFDARDGQALSKTDIDSQPVFDGMAAAHGRLYISAIDGTVSCFGQNQE
ncbi:MAG: hypothetical protein AMJ65_18770 [Phycisphaerae bacterium SG8_4]|nr:MAG: hypothetical protein AMJ65_18770 [Phycisphaerae bacterium SG8_4]